jgi:type II secretion system protein C
MNPRVPERAALHREDRMAALTAQNRWVMGGLFVGVAILSWLAAMGTGRIIAARLALPDDAAIEAIEVGVTAVADASEGTKSTSRPRLRRTPSKSTYVDPIVRRNIFDSSAVGVATTGPVDIGEGGRRSDLKVVLLATIVAEPVDYSSALIAEEKGSGGATGYGINDSLLGEATIVRIEPRKIYVRRTDGTIEYIAMEEGKTFEKTGKGSKTDKGDDDSSGVSKEGNKFVVEQALIDKMLENPEQLYSQIRAVPHKGTDGKIDGYRLSGIRRKSVFHKLGIKNGDIVHGVNGAPLTSMSSAMDSFNSLKNERSFSFDVSRRNKRSDFEYEVR